MFDFEKLREDLKNDSLGAFFGGGFGGALIESFNLDDATDDELIKIARDRGIDLNKYQK